MEAEVLLHEILHAIWYTFNLYLDKKAEEEKAVTIISTALSTVFVQNPSLLPYFRSCWK